MKKRVGLIAIFVLVGLFFCFEFVFSLSVSAVTLNNSDGSQTTNYGDKDLFVNFTTDGTQTANITDWRRDNVSLAIINMPFDVNETEWAGSVMDYSTNANFGSVIGGGPLSYSTNCIKGGCFNFSDVSYYLRIENDSSFANVFQSGSDFSVSFWVNFNTNSSTFMPILNTADVLNNYNGFAIWRYQDALRVYRASSGSDQNTLTLLGALPQTDQWYHIAYVYSGSSSTGTLYLDNVAYSDSDVMIPRNNIVNLYFGKAGAFYLNGTLDEFMMFNHSLTATEVSNLYSLGNNNQSLVVLPKEAFSKNGNYSVSVWTSNKTENSTVGESNFLEILTPCVDFSDGESRSLTRDYNLSLDSCISLANNSILDCGGYSLNGTSNNFVFSNNKRNITIKNCNFLNYNVSLNLSNSEDVVVFNNTFQEGYYGIFSESLSNLSIFNNTFISAGFNVWSSIRILNLNNSNISQNNFSLSFVNTSGIYGQEVNYTTVSNNIFGSPEDPVNSSILRAAGVLTLFQPNYDLISHNNIYIGDNISGIVMARNGASTGKMHDNVIENNYVNISTANNVFGLVNTEAGTEYVHINWTVRNNVISSKYNLTSGQHTSMFKWQNGSRYYNNTIIGGGYGLVFKDSVNSKIYDNTFFNQSVYEIHPKGVQDSEIYENTLYSSFSTYPILTYWDSALGIIVNNLSIYDNVFFGSSVIGIHTNSSNVKITNQSITLYPVDLRGGSVYLKWWFMPKVVSSTGGAISGATINVQNSSNVSIYNISTDSSGYPSRVSLEEYLRNETSTYYQENYSATISKSGYASRTISFNLSLTNNYISEIALTAIATTSTTTSTDSSSGSYIPSSTLENGYTRIFNSGQSASLNIGSENYVAKVTSVSTESVSVIVDGSSVDVSVGTSEKVDLDSDGVYDLEITVNSVDSSGNANLEFKAISEAVPSEVQEEVSEEVITEEEKPLADKTSNWYLYVLGVVALLIVLGILFEKLFRKKKKHKK